MLWRRSRANTTFTSILFERRI